MMNKISTLFLILILVVGVAGCSRPQFYGNEMSEGGITPIEDILIKPADFEKKTILVKGKIVSECNTGCWFNIQEGGAIIYVDLNPSGFAIRQHIGRTVLVEGEVVLEEKTPILIGKGVKVQ